MKSFLKNTWKNRTLVLMTLPGVILLFMFAYVPLSGLVVAFKDFNYAKGIWGSEWVGFKNFRFLFTSSGTTIRMIRNTIGYYFIFTFFGTIANVSLALALNECISKRFAKVSQTLMILPTFISWIAVNYIVNAFLDGSKGIVTHMMMNAGRTPIQWYVEAKYWPVILTIVNLWKNTGYSSILYLSALAGMDEELFEAAELDGATKWQQIRYIKLPLLTSMVSIITLMGLGGIMTSNTGLFYQVTRNSGPLYSTTQTIDAYVMSALRGGNSSVNFGMLSAVTMLQSVVGCFMVVVVNLIVRKKAPDHSLF